MNKDQNNIQQYYLYQERIRSKSLPNSFSNELSYDYEEEYQNKRKTSFDDQTYLQNAQKIKIQQERIEQIVTPIDFFLYIENQ